MTVVLPNPTFASSITKLPLNLRSRALRKFSANANAPGGSKKQIGRAQQEACQRLTTVLGVYCIESRVTGALAASIGGARPANITSVPASTPATAAVATIPPSPPPLIPVTYAGAGSKVLTAATTYGPGEAVVVL
jgi:hypothetical protein